eukprot:2865440-Alexandrium_andersonii.AAC.1
MRCRGQSAPGHLRSEFHRLQALRRSLHPRLQPLRPTGGRAQSVTIGRRPVTRRRDRPRLVLRRLG